MSTDGMPLFGHDGAVRHRTQHGYVVDALGSGIVAGRFLPGEVLPSETELSAQLGVSRGALREAAKALVAKGLLELRPRIGTKVRPSGEWNFLDQDVLRWQEQADRRTLLSDLDELRQAVEPSAARLAATRATAEDVDALMEAYRDMTITVKAEAHKGFTEADIAFHRGLLRASHNQLYISLGNATGVALRASFQASSSVPGAVEATVSLHGDIAREIAGRDPDRAYAAAAKLMAVAGDYSLGRRVGGARKTGDRAAAAPSPRASARRRVTGKD